MGRRFHVREKATMNRLERIAAILSLAGGLVLVSTEPAAAQVPGPPAVQRQETAKYSAYIEAINPMPNWAHTLLEFRRESAPAIEQGPLRSLGVADDYPIDQAYLALDKVLEMPGTLADADPLARQLSANLKALAPISHELQEYGASKGFLVDKGKRARELGKPYMEALQAAAEKQDQLAETLDSRDYKLAADVFAAAPKGTPLYDAAGMTYFGKQNAMDARRLARSPLDAAALAAFQKSTGQFADMAANWNREMRKDQPQGCARRMQPINEFIAMGREIASKLQEGDYARRAKKDGDTPTTGRRGGLDDDIRLFFAMYHSVVIVENQQLC
jgi:hypothetical protein